MTVCELPTGPLSEAGASEMLGAPVVTDVPNAVSEASMLPAKTWPFPMLGPAQKSPPPGSL